MSEKTLKNLFYGTVFSGLMFAGTACSNNEQESNSSENTTKTETTTQNNENDKYGNVALFEKLRSKNKFALSLVENYYPYVYFCGKAWTTGDGLTILYNADGTSEKVTEKTRIPTMAESDVFKGRYMSIEILRDIKKYVKVPMDENTMIATCVFRYCVGSKNFQASQFLKQLNAGKRGAELAKTLTGWRDDAGVPKRLYFFAALMEGKIQFSDLLYLRAEGCYLLTWKDIFVYENGEPKKDAKDFYEWDFSKIEKNLEIAKGNKTTLLTIYNKQTGKKEQINVKCKLAKDIVPDYVWQEVSNGAKQNTIMFEDANADAQNDVSYIACNNGDYKTALDAAKLALKAAKTAKQYGASYYNMGMAYMGCNEYKQAEKCFQESLKHNDTKAAKDALAEAQKKCPQASNWPLYVGLGIGAIGAAAYARKKYKKGK